MPTAFRPRIPFGPKAKIVKVVEALPPRPKADGQDQVEAVTGGSSEQRHHNPTPTNITAASVRQISSIEGYETRSKGRGWFRRELSVVPGTSPEDTT